MKSVLISVLLVIGSVTAKANATYESASAPVFANLSLNGYTRNMSLVNPRFHSVTNATVTFNSKTVQLTVNKSMPPCGAGMMCIQVMPAPLQINLQVVQVINTGCAVKYVATTPANVKTSVYEVITIEDHSNSKCDMYLSSVGTVTYEATGVSSLSKQQETATAIFHVQEQFIRAAN